MKAFNFENERKGKILSNNAFNPCFVVYSRILLICF
jgi:hypothetical protein